MLQRFLGATISFNLIAARGERTAQPYAQLAESLGSSEAAIKSAVHRLRQRYRQLLREEVAGTVDSPDDVEDELRHLFAALTS